jgi:hypothetical protein
MNSLDKVKRYIKWNKSTYIKLAIKKDIDLAEKEAIQQYLSDIGMIRRPDYEIKGAKMYEIYVNQTFHDHNIALFSSRVKSLSIIPIVRVGDGAKIVLSKKMMPSEYLPLTINWGSNLSIADAIKLRIKEEFEMDTISSHKLDIKCDIIPYHNVCLGKNSSNYGITRQWSYYVVLISDTIASNPNIKLCDLGEFIANIKEIVDHYWLGQEIDNAVTKLIKN